MKKVIISVSAVLLVLIIAISVYFIFIKNKSEQADNPDTVLTPTAEPFSAAAPTVTPLPEQSQKESILYPAFQKVRGELKYGYIDGTGTFVLQPAYDYACDFSEGAAVVKVGENYQAIDQTGSVIFANNNTITPFHNGTAAFLKVSEASSLYGYIDPKGQVIIEPKYTFAGDFNEEGRAYAALPDGKTYELIDKNGNVIKSYDLKLGNIRVDALEDGYVVYHDSDSIKYGVASVSGETVFKPDYSFIAYLGRDLFAVKEPALEPYQTTLAPAALYNAEGDKLTDYSLYDLQHFKGAYSSAADETSIFFIGTDGREITSLPSYEGGGALMLLGDVVKAEIDGDLTYYRLDNTILWQNDTTTRLTSEISVKEMKFRPLRSVIVRYPRIEGLADGTIQKQINEQLETLFTESRANITKEDALSVNDSFDARLTENLLEISMSGYDYSEGQAQGMPLQEHYFIDITTGTFYELKDLFKKDSDYKTKIDEIIRAKIDKEVQKEDSMYFEDSFTGITDAQHFYLNDDGITIYFYPYDIAAYAAGFPEFKIPYDDLTDYIDTKGAFWKSFHKE